MQRKLSFLIGTGAVLLIVSSVLFLMFHEISPSRERVEKEITFPAAP